MNRAEPLTLSANSFAFVDLDWAEALAHPELFGDEVHLWWLSLDASEQTAKRYLQYLGPAEQAKYERLPEGERRSRWLTGRGILRELIAAYLRLEPARVRLRFGLRGKPWVSEAHDLGGQLHFNYSDSEGMGLYAFSLDREVGADLEWLGRRGRFARIIERRFAESEKPHLTDGLDDTALAERFLACWTRKEGYGKARGVGIYYPMGETELCNDCNLPSQSVNAGHGDWHMRQLLLPPDYVGCVVVEGSEELPIRAFTRKPG